MKTLIFSRRLRQNRGGVELFNENLMMLLGDKCIHASERSASQMLVASYASRLSRTLRISPYTRRQPVIVQYGSFLDILFLPMLRIFWRNLFVIAHVSDTWKHLKNPILRRLSLTVLYLFVRKLLIISEDQRRVFRGLSVFKIHTIIHSTFAIPADRIGKEREGFVFIGRVTPEKGVIDAISAWAELPEPKPKLRLYGPASERMLQELNRQIGKYGLGDSITYLGAERDPAILASIYRASKAVVYPSYADAFPLVMLESLSQGTPCIITAVGEVANFLGEEYPLMIQPGDTSAMREAVLSVEGSFAKERVTDDLVDKARSYARGAIVSDLQAVGAVTHA